MFITDFRKWNRTVSKPDLPYHLIFFLFQTAGSKAETKICHIIKKNFRFRRFFIRWPVINHRQGYFLYILSHTRRCLFHQSTQWSENFPSETKKFWPGMAVCCKKQNSFRLKLPFLCAVWQKGASARRAAYVFHTKTPQNLPYRWFCGVYNEKIPYTTWLAAVCAPTEEDLISLRHRLPLWFRLLR